MRRLIGDMNPFVRGLIVVGLIAVVLAAVNLVGGFVVTDRMLEMFKGRGGPRS